MNKKFQTVSGVKIYPIEYLTNEELTEADLSNIFDTPSLLYSIFVHSKYIELYRVAKFIIPPLYNVSIWYKVSLSII